jgi:hypothetical protein
VGVCVSALLAQAAQSIVWRTCAHRPATVATVARPWAHVLKTFLDGKRDIHPRRTHGDLGDRWSREHLERAVGERIWPEELAYADLPAAAEFHAPCGILHQLGKPIGQALRIAGREQQAPLGRFNQFGKGPMRGLHHGHSVGQRFEHIDTLRLAIICRHRQDID